MSLIDPFMTYQKRNNLTGWIVFSISLLVYLLTVAPTASFWDCGEFIACANELEVTHPPGAPLFLLLGRIFAIFSFGNVEMVAFMVNLISVFASAFTALFTCWITTGLAQRGLAHTNWATPEKDKAALLAGLIAGLCCAFADSVWFNAVEAEVYALSSFFTSLVVWLMFKWEARAHEPDHLRWIVLIAYLMGLSIGVHLLNLLTIPALALLYFYKKFPFSWKGFLLTMGLSIGVLAFIQYGIIQESFAVASWFELLFTGAVKASGEDIGGMGMPIGTGSLIWGSLLLLLISALVFISQKRKWVGLNVSMLALVVIMIGFSSYALIPIRSQVNPSIDMNNPENVLTFLSYMKREQYGQRPLWKGPLYNTDVKRNDKGYPLKKTKGNKYVLLEGSDKYVFDVTDEDYIYEKEVIFPRMWSPDRYSAGPYGYINYVSDKGQNPQSPYDDKPSRMDDLRFFLDYQFNHMYLRYFMWNFAGRTSDEQDSGWEDGLLISSRFYKQNKGNNHYYFLPLLLGIMGIVWQFSFKRKDAAVMGMLFLLTGIAIIIYLNQYPAQPRERDYSFAGSFQTFAIWIGLGILFLIELCKRILKNATIWVVGAFGLLIPLIMLFQNWDDHTRKGRWVDIEFAKNILNSCAKDAILFTGGDNDTFPLWYVQEVEGYRTDVRIVNLELLVSDWYIKHMTEPHNGSLPVPISMNPADYAGEKGIFIPNYPSKLIELPAKKGDLLMNGVIKKEELAMLGEPEGNMKWKVRARGTANNPYILRKDSVMINIISNIAKDGWKRPVYFANTLSPSNLLNLNDFLRMEGLASRLVPLPRTTRTPNDVYYGWVSRARMMENFSNQFLFSGLDDPGVNHDEHIRERVIGNYRQSLFRLNYTYVGEILKLRQANQGLMQLADSLPNTRDSAFAQIKSNQDLMGLARNNIRVGLAFGEKHIPSSVVKMGPTQAASILQLLIDAEMEEEAETYSQELLRNGFTKIEAMKKDGMQISDRNLEMRSLLLGIQYQMSKDQQKGLALIKRLEAITGEGLLRRRQE